MDVQSKKVDARRLTAILTTWGIAFGLNLTVGSTSVVKAQTIALNDLPPPGGNTRFFSDEYPIDHPSLSLNGFDCASHCHKSLGLKQILEEVYNESTFEIRQVFLRLIDVAAQSYDFSPATVGDVRANTQRLQARAVVALSSYVLHEEGANPTSLNPALPAAGDALTDFRAALMDFDSWAIDQSLDPEGDATDALKWSTTVANVARAIDLYLALENAYKHYDVAEYNDVNSAELLSESEKEDLLLAYTLLIDDLENLGGEAGGVAGVDAYDVQAGNWPLKVQVAIGYSLLTWQDSGATVACETDCDFDDWLSRAFYSAAGPNSSDFNHHWYFQTDGGKRFWAEGPYYFHLALSEIIPFWHTVRINDLRSETGLVGFTIANEPFFASWLTTPLEWLADVVTPDGKTPHWTTATSRA